ncbi:hypothetical protein HK098_007088 [Nowakowskiella sp. JEL0407]|nr:hypothetical protein HK098_007088 [Nowakowskiella sp. JEL0407]
MHPTNPLLVKDLVGKTRPTVYDLPDSSHVYGKKIERNPEECAATVLHKWHIKSNPKSTSASSAALDYIAMNRSSTKLKIVDASLVREFRKSHPIRVKVGDHSRSNPSNGNAAQAETTAEWLKRRCRGNLPSDSDPYFSYGQPTRPSTPVAKLMTDTFQREWIEEQQKAENERNKLEKQKRKQTKPHLIKPHQPPARPKFVPIAERDVSNLFKMSKFKSVDPKITCWRENDDVAIAPILKQHEAFRERELMKKSEESAVGKADIVKNRALEKVKKRKVVKVVNVIAEKKEGIVESTKKVVQHQQPSVMEKLPDAREIRMDIASISSPTSTIKVENAPAQTEIVVEKVPEEQKKKEKVRFAMLEPSRVRPPVRGIREVEGELRVL